MLPEIHKLMLSYAMPKNPRMVRPLIFTGQCRRSSSATKTELQSLEGQYNDCSSWIKEYKAAVDKQLSLELRSGCQVRLSAVPQSSVSRS